jgi:hypothetical protein
MSNKVYVLMCASDWEAPELIGVYSYQHNAELAAADLACTTKSFDKVYIYEYELDTEIPRKWKAYRSNMEWEEDE